MKASKLLKDARIELQDRGGHNWSNDELISYLNTAVRTFALKVENLWPDSMAATSLYEQATWDLKLDKGKYALPEDFWRILEVFVNGERQTSLTVAEAQDGQDGYMLLENRLRIVPKPDEFHEDGLELYYLVTPKRIESPTQEIPLGDDYYDVILESVKLQAKARGNENVAIQQQLMEVMNEQLSFQQNQTNTGELSLTPPNENWI